MGGRDVPVLGGTIFAVCGEGEVREMDAGLQSLAKLLSLAALIGATIDYVEVVKRRQQQRTATAQRVELEAAGLRGLARFMGEDKNVSAGR